MLNRMVSSGTFPELITFEEASPFFFFLGFTPVTLSSSKFMVSVILMLAFSVPLKGQTCSLTLPNIEGEKTTPSSEVELPNLMT